MDPHLAAVLAARDERAAAQSRMLADTGMPLVSLSIVSPGPDKLTAAAAASYEVALSTLRECCAARGWDVHDVVEAQRVTGPEALVAVAGPSAVVLKAAMADLEDQHPWGRLWDLDVLTSAGPVSRTQIGRAPRRCLRCARPSAQCARSRRHSVTELLERIAQIVACPPSEDWADRAPLTPPLAVHLGNLARHALELEARLTPKPGLVDRADSGAHDDMDLALMLTSATALHPHLVAFASIGLTTRDAGEDTFLARLRDEGLRAEDTMRAATGGVNTHKGAIFALGWILGVTARLTEGGVVPSAAAVCTEIGRLAAPMLAELTAPLGDGRDDTAGRQLFHQFGMTGARGEAASGYAIALRAGLPAYERARARGADEDEALHDVLLILLADNGDTNLAKDGGWAAVESFRTRARDLLAAGGAAAPDFLTEMGRWNAEAIAQGLSPGGSADLVAVTWLLAALPDEYLLG